ATWTRRFQNWNRTSRELVARRRHRRCRLLQLVRRAASSNDESQSPMLACPRCAVRLALLVCACAIGLASASGCGQGGNSGGGGAGAGGSEVQEQYRAAVDSLQSAGAHVSVDSSGVPRAVNLSKEAIDDTVATQLAGLTGLQTLYVTKTAITDAG